MATFMVRGRKRSHQTDADDPHCHRMGSVSSSSEGGGERMSLQGQTGERTADSLTSNGEDQAVNSQPGNDRPALDLQSKRDRLWIFLDDPSVSRGAYWWSISILILILLSCTAFVVETIPSMCCGRYDHVWGVIELICVTAFTVEYLGRFLVCPTWVANKGGELMFSSTDSGIKAEILCRFRFCIKILNIVDLAAILPSLITYASPGQSNGGNTTSFLRVIRLARVFRLFKLSKYSEGMHLLSSTMVRSWRALGMLGFFMLIAVVVFSSIMYFVERGEYFWCSAEAARQKLCSEEDVATRTEGQPLEFCAAWVQERYSSSQEGLQCCWGEAWYVPFDFNGDGCADKSQYDSILQTAWWCVVTMTTVGYGDVVPLTTEGKLVATFTMLGGILILALPITVIGSNFNIEYENRVEAKERKAALEGKSDTDSTKSMKIPSLSSDPNDHARSNLRSHFHAENQSALIEAIDNVLSQQREAILKKAEEMMSDHIRVIAREVVAQSLVMQNGEKIAATKSDEAESGGLSPMGSHAGRGHSRPPES